MSPQPNPQGYPQAGDGDKLKDGDARWETGELSRALREEVLERDQGHCRVCGGVPESPAIHHVRYRSEGGLNVVENLITVHWMYWPRCHERMHSNKRLYQRLGLVAAVRPGVTVLQLMRWERRQR